MVGAVFVTALVAAVGAYENSSATRPAPPHVAPLTSGTVCGLIVIPAVIVMGSPLGGLAAIASFILAMFMSSIAGRWESDDMVGRAALTGISFAGVTGLILLSLAVGSLFQLPLLISDTYMSVINAVGGRC